MKNVVLIMNHDAEGILLYIVPIVLRISVNIINVDQEACSLKQNIKTFHLETCKSLAQDLGLFISDSLNYHESSINVIIMDGHYDILYKQSDVQDFNLTLMQDDLFNKRVNEFKQFRIE